jgi:hypothetical protein
MKTLIRIASVSTLLLGWWTAPVQAFQDLHILHPIGTLEQALRYEPLQVASQRGSRAVGDRTQRVSVVFDRPDLVTVEVKWAVAPPNGDAFNNMPRYEVAAYEIQKLFLDPADYVVPPTVLRSFPLEWYRQNYEATASPTFSRTGSVIVALQYWLAPPLLPHTSLDRSRAASDEAYARHIGNMNVLAYLIRHRDNNPGNFLISGTGTPRVFAVDNGVAFRSDASDRGHYWSNLNVTRISAATAERLRAIDLAGLERGLSVVAQFELQGEALQQVEPGVALDPSRGTRRRGDTLQFGLSSGEIREVHGRLQRLLQMLDTGRIATF